MAKGVVRLNKAIYRSAVGGVMEAKWQRTSQMTTPMLHNSATLCRSFTMIDFTLFCKGKLNLYRLYIKYPFHLEKGNDIHDR